MTSQNLVESIIDEVALEGLDGITLQGLWIRLANRFHNSLPFPKTFMEQVWSICKMIKDFSFYKLKIPREPLVLFDRYEYVHPDLGIIFEPPNVPLDIYPHFPIEDSKIGVRGSCSTYYTRKDITNNVKKESLDEIMENYGLSLVIVASQPIRTRALLSTDVSPTLELTIMHYCFLERVGRARYHGEITQGKLSLAALKQNPKTLFYHRKFLLQHKLITKQVHHQKSAGHCGSGSLLHLPRFYVERKPKMIYLAEQVLEILRSKENGVADYDEVKKKLGIENSIKKLFKTSFFQKIVKTDICVPYRTLYPNAEPNEWRQKQDPSKEKKIRVIQLLYPDIDIIDVWNKEEKDDEEDFAELDITKHKFNVPYLKQANTIIEANQLEGISQTYLGKEMGVTKLHSRTILRNMVKMGIVATYMNDVGRQRITKYVSKKFEKNSKMSKQFNKEMHKIKELTQQIVNESEEKLIKKAISQVQNEKPSVQHKNDQKTQKSHSDDHNDQTDVKVSSVIVEDEHKDKNKDENKDKDRNAHCAKNVKLKNSFHAVNGILRKYQMSKFISKYRYLSSQSSLLKKKSSNTDVKQQKSNVLSTSLQQITNDTKSTSLYNSIKMNLTAQKPAHTEKGVNDAFSFMDVVQNSEKSNSNITYRLLRRANMIIEAVKEHQVIDDMTKLMKMICEEEDKEGYDKKIDKKSLIRLLQKLAKDNLVKNIKLTLSTNGREKNLTFICDPNIDTDHTVIKSAVEQAKVKFCLLVSQKAKVTKKIAIQQQKIDDETNSKEQSELDKAVPEKTLMSYKYDVKAGRYYGLSPKFIRMQTIHVLLFYLVYDHLGVPKLSQEEQVEILRANGYKIDDKLAQEFTTIYNTEVSWKMFVPPLPKHNGWPDGWTLMCDVLLGLPLSIFVKVHNITFVIPELEHYLNHPIRKHYLIKNLPITIRNTLLHARKYIYNIHDTIIRLAYIGLVQFGPQRLKEKDQVFIYVNRRTELMDTVSSAPNYHKIEDKQYPVTKYLFDRTQDVEKYWYDMWTICVNTPLGGRLVVHGKDILLEDLNKKTAMTEAITARTPKETVEKDTGAVPGDRKGAAGIDSAFFAHLKRNWNWSANYRVTDQQASGQQNKNQKKSSIGQRDLHLSRIQTNPVKYTEYNGLKKVSGPPILTLNAAELRKKVHDHLSKAGRKNEALPSHQSSKQKSFVRRVMPRKKNARPRIKYDEDDYQALQRMEKLRVDWDSHEDNILLMCKVATMYLSPNPRKQVVNFIAVRDVLRTFSYSSYNKTSRACQRRLMYMLKQSRTMNSVALGVEEIKQDSFVDRRYGGVMEKLKSECANSVEYEKRVTEVFKELVTYIVKKYYEIAEIKPTKHTEMPKTKQQFDLFYELVYPANPRHNQGFTKDVHNTNDIHSATINSIIHSSMCSGKDRRCWAYQLFKVYQQYPEALLRQAMSKIKADQMVTVKKHHLANIKKYGNYMPMSSAQYQLSINYIYKLQTKWPYNMFKECYEVYAKLLQSYVEHRNNPSQGQVGTFNGTEILPVSNGIITVMHDLLACQRIDFDIEMPDQIIMLDARYQGKDETYFRVAQRYQDILTRLYRFKYENVETQGAELSELGTKSQDETQENCIKRKRTDKNNLEEPIAKIPRMDESNSEEKEKGSQQNNIITESISVQHEESTQKDFADYSRKRPINVEEDSTDCEKPVLKKVKLSSEDSMELEDIERNEELNLCEDLEDIDKNKPFGSTTELKAQEKEEEVPLKHLDSSSKASVSQRVNEIISNMPHEMSYLGPYSKLENTNDMQKKYTRIALLRMKEELNDLTVADSHHAHEFFVVNSFKMYYSLMKSPSSTSSNDIDFKDHSVPTQFVALKIETVNDFLDEVSRFSTFPKNGISYTDYKNEVTTKKLEVAIDWKHADAIHKFVHENKDIGVSSQELLDKFFNEQKTELYNIVSLLTKNHIFLRSGVTKPRYIHRDYVDPWLIHSCKIYRLEQESVVPFKDSIYAKMSLEKKTEASSETDAEHDKETNEKSAEDATSMIAETDDAIPSTSSWGIENQETQEMKDKRADEDDKEENGETNEENAPARRSHKRTYLLPQKDVYKSAQQLDFTTAEEIKVVIKPWIRIDGVLNRKVLDRMLGTILNYCMLRPGVTMAKIQSRFIPVLQPFHTRELIEMLIKLGCLESKFLKKTRVTLFSQPSTIMPTKLSADTVGWFAEDEIILEPTIDSMLKFSIFLSTKTYSTDFIS